MVIERPVMPLSARYTPYFSLIAPRGRKSGAVCPTAILICFPPVLLTQRQASYPIRSALDKPSRAFYVATSRSPLRGFCPAMSRAFLRVFPAVHFVSGESHERRSASPRSVGRFAAAKCADGFAAAK